MSGLKEFSIPFTGLSDGSHEYRFVVTNTFFEAFPYSEIKKGNVQVDVTLVRHSLMLTLDIRIKGEVELTCDRCTSEYMQPVEGQYRLVVNLNAERFEDEDDLISLPESAHELDLAKYLYEYITLLVPSRRVCGGNPDAPDGCDPETISTLEKLKPGKVTKKKEKEEEPEETDPRWDSLKNIKFDDN